MSTENSKWQTYFSTLEEVRKSQKAHAAPVIGLLLLGLIGFVILSLSVGFQVAVVSMIVLAFLFLNFGHKIKGVSNWTQKRSKIDAQASSVEHRILTAVAHQIAPWLRVRLGSAPLAEPIKNSKLIEGRIDFVHPSRCLTGVFQNEIGFCLSQIDVGRVETYVDSKKRKQTSQKIHFQGLFLIVDYPTQLKDPVYVDSDRLESLGWLAHEWRQSTGQPYIRMDNPDFEKHFHVKASSSVEGFRMLSPDLQERLVAFKDKHPNLPCSMCFKDDLLMIAFPMKKSPFVFRDNPDQWEDELMEFKKAATMTVHLMESLCLKNFSERSEAV